MLELLFCIYIWGDRKRETRGRERETGESWASSKTFDSATGSPLTRSGDNMWPKMCVCVLFCFLEKRGHEEFGKQKDCSNAKQQLSTFFKIKLNRN